MNHNNLVTFGLKNRTTPENYVLFDVRTLPNPYNVPNLRQRDGRDLEVQRYILESPKARGVIKKLKKMLDQGVYVAVACHGGKHRSVAIAEIVNFETDGKYQMFHMEIKN